jgi:Predicted esterase of the alpha/beta hydrolase fold
MNKVLLLHGYNGIPLIFYYIKQELEKLEYSVIMPSLPTQECLRYNIWREEFKNIKEDLGNDLIIIAHSGGNPFIIKYLKENNLKVNLYIGLAGFSDMFTTEGRKDLDEAVGSLVPSNEEIEKFKNNVKVRYCIYSDSDHIIPFEILRKHADNVNAKHWVIPNIGHMGRKSNLQKLPQVIEIIKKEMSSNSTN